MQEENQTPLGKKETTRTYLRQSITRAVRLVESRLEDPPSVDEMAKTAGVSRSHFQRTFREVVGESTKAFTMRVRIERAASLLRYSTWRINDIAISCGYHNQANFGRDFAKIYGASPRNFRSREASLPFLRGYIKGSDQSANDDDLSDNPPLSVLVETWPELSGIALRTHGSISQAIGCWNELLEWAKTQPTLSDFEKLNFLGCWYDTWDGINEDTYRYDAVIVPSTPFQGEIPAPFLPITIPAGKVASLHAKGSINKIESIWKAFGEGWLPLSGLQPRGDIAGIDKYPAELANSTQITKLLKFATRIEQTLIIPVQEGPIVLP